MWAEVSAGYRLPRPPACPPAVYDKMLACWAEDPRQRIEVEPLKVFFRSAMTPRFHTLDLEGHAHDESNDYEEPVPLRAPWPYPDTTLEYDLTSRNPIEKRIVVPNYLSMMQETNLTASELNSSGVAAADADATPKPVSNPSNARSKTS